MKYAMKKMEDFIMCYYIGIEDLVANALIEIVDNKDVREVSLKKLNEYGEVVIRTLNSFDKEAILLLSRDRTNEFIHNCTEYFDVNKDKEGNYSIFLKEGVTTDKLREQFRRNISLNVLRAFIDENSLKVLGVA